MPDLLRAGIADLTGLLQTPAAVVREEALGGRRQMIRDGATLTGSPLAGMRGDRLEVVIDRDHGVGGP